MTSRPDDRVLLKPLTSLSFISEGATRVFLCQSGRLKWRADTKALSIKATIVASDSDALDSSANPVTLVATAERRSARYVLSKGFAAQLECGTASRSRPLTFSYHIEAVAQPSQEIQNA